MTSTMPCTPNVWYALNRATSEFLFRCAPCRSSAQRIAMANPSFQKTPRALLRKQPLFQCMDQAANQRLAQRRKSPPVRSRRKIIEQDAEGNSMFILIQGSARVYVNHNGRAGTSSHTAGRRLFGEMSLPHWRKRSATVVAASDWKFWKSKTRFSPKYFRKIPAAGKSSARCLLSAGSKTKACSLRPWRRKR